MWDDGRRGEQGVVLPRLRKRRQVKVGWLARMTLSEEAMGSSEATRCVWDEPEEKGSVVRPDFSLFDE